MKFKFGVKQIVLTVVTVVLIAILIAGNIILNANALILHKMFSSMTKKYDVAGGEAYEMGDALVPQLVEDSVVLLRNEDNALPLDSSKDKEKKVNLFGWNSTTNGFLLTGTGSGGSKILDENRVTLAEAFTQAGYEYNTDLYDAYASNLSGPTSTTINNVGQMSTTSMQAIQNPGSSFYTADRMGAARDYSDVAIIVLSRNTGENCGTGETLNFTGYSNGAWLELTENEKLMLKNVTEWFSDGKVIVLLNTTNTMELGFLEEYGVDAALYIGAPGQSGARAIPQLLYGEKEEKVAKLDEDGNLVYDEDGTVVYEKNEDGTDKTEMVKISPSGRTSDTYAYNYNLDENGKNYSASWTSAISNNGSIYYQEGIYIGYKWYETAYAEGFFEANGTTYESVVQYPFGYGLSYTTFKWTVEKWPSAKELTKDGKYEVEVIVENTGKVPGKDVVELYYTPPYTNGEIEKAAINLLAFAKTGTIQPGGRQLVTLSFTAYDLASYDDYDKNGNGFTGYELDSGKHVIKLMEDSHYATRLEKNTYEFDCKGIQFDKDPVTDTEVVNLFTGDDAWDGIPVDGSTAFTNGIDYLSRKDSFANFPKETTYQCKAVNSSPNKTTESKAWDNADISGFNYGDDAGMYLVTDEEGNQVSKDALEGGNDVKLKFNTELLKTLSDYDADEWDDFLNQLTQDEIKDLIRQGAFQTVSLVSVGKPKCNEYDGPAGFNRNSVAGAPMDPKWVVFPAEILLGCSWNQQSTYNMGKAMGIIGTDTGVHGWYGPGLNLHRSPYYGRNFEYYSEDAVLTGKLVAECIRGAKEQNLVCYMKHFVCADTGPNSNNWYTWLTEQNLRENYLRPFEIAVKEGGANAVMSGFSLVGATWAGSNYALSTQILRNEWGFRGSMITDWYDSGLMNLTRGIKGGNDLWLGSATTNINFSNAAEAYCARQSAKNILYTYVDCAVTALNYDPNASVTAGESDYSALFAALWAIVDILLVLGIATCVIFILFTPAQIAQLFKGKKATQTVEGGAAEETPSAEPETAEETPEEEAPATEEKPEE